MTISPYVWYTILVTKNLEEGGSMKKIFIIAVAILATGIFTLFSSEKGIEKEFREEKYSDAYRFPVTPGMKEWRKFKTNEEMIAATQIPKDLLITMSTEGLIETCLNFPLFMDMTAFNSYEEGFNHIKQNFNGLRELLKRTDAGGKLLNRYKYFNPVTFQKTAQSVPPVQYFKPFIMEILLSNDEILSSMSSKERHSLCKLAVKKFRLKEQYPETYGYEELIPPGVIMKKVMELESHFYLEKDYRIPTHSSDYDIVNSENLETIVNQAERFLDEKKR